MFIGNKDRDIIVYHNLNPPIQASFIRLRPTAWSSHISLRMELYGCLGMIAIWLLETFVITRNFLRTLAISLSGNQLAAQKSNSFLLGLTALRLGAESSKIKMAFFPLDCFSWHFLISWGVREPQQIVLVHCTHADNARQDVSRWM